jgi:hypothetical protein
MDWILKHKFIAIGAALVLAGLAWYMLGGTTAPSDSVLTTQNTAQVPADAQELVSSLLTLRAVTLNANIFTNPSFQALKDFSTPIITESVGRANPFAPLGQSALLSTSTKVKTQ